MKTTRFIRFFFFALLSVTLSAHAAPPTPIWGAGASTGAADGEFQSAFTNSTTTSYSNTAWTALTISDASGTPGNAYWVRNTTGAGQGAYVEVPTDNFASPTFANGVALFDSDFMDTGGTVGAFGTGTAPAPQEGHLVSPLIDLTGYSDVPLEVTFYLQARPSTIYSWGVSMSTDGGFSWTDVPIPTPTSDDRISEWYTASFPNITAGVTNLTQSRVRIQVNADQYYVMVDDLSIAEELFEPEANSGGPYMVTAGDPLTVDGSASSDSNGSITAYDWDLDNDGQFDDASGATVDLGIQDVAGSRTIALRVTDNEGYTDAASTTITVEDPADDIDGSDILFNDDSGGSASWLLILIYLLRLRHRRCR